MKRTTPGPGPRDKALPTNTSQVHGGRRRRRIFRAAVSGTILAAMAALLVSQCDVDPGLLDANSEQSELARQRVAELKDNLYVQQHGTDVQYDTVAFVGAMCVAVDTLNKTLQTAPQYEGPVPLEQARADSRALLTRIAADASTGRDSIYNTPAPTWNRILHPDGHSGYWIDLKNDITQSFDHFKNEIQTINHDLETRDSSTPASIDNANKRTTASIESFASTTNSNFKRAYIPNQETADELARRNLCTESSTND